MAKRTILVLLVLAWCAAPLGHRLFQPFLSTADKDAAIYAKSAHNFLRHGPIATRLGMTLNNGEDPPKFFYNDHHPPGVALATAGVYGILGVSDWASRVYPALCTLGAALMLFLLWKRHRGAGPALLAVAVLATLPAYGHFGMKLGEEAPTLFWGLLAVVLYQRWKDRVGETADAGGTGRAGLMSCLAAYAIGCFSGWAAFYVGPLLMLDAVMTLRDRRRMRRAALTSLGLATLGCTVIVLGHLMWLSGSMEHLQRTAGGRFVTDMSSLEWLRLEAVYFLRLFGSHTVLLGLAGVASAAIALMRGRWRGQIVMMLLVLLGLGVLHPIVFKGAAFRHDWLLFHLLPLVSIAMGEGILLLASILSGMSSRSPGVARSARVAVIAGSLAWLMIAGARGLQGLSTEFRRYAWPLLGKQIARMAPGESSIMSNLLIASHPLAFYADRTIHQAISLSDMRKRSDNLDATLYLRDLNGPIPQELESFLSSRSRIDLAGFRVYDLKEPAGVAGEAGAVAPAPDAWAGDLDADFESVVKLTGFRIEGPTTAVPSVSPLRRFFGFREGTLTHDRIVLVTTFWSTSRGDLPEWKVFMNLRSRPVADRGRSLPLIALDDRRRPRLSDWSGLSEFRIHGAFMFSEDFNPGDFDLYISLDDRGRSIKPVLPGPPRPLLKSVPIGPIPLPGG